MCVRLPCSLTVNLDNREGCCMAVVDSSIRWYLYEV